MISGGSGWLYRLIKIVASVFVLVHLVLLYMGGFRFLNFLLNRELVMLRILVCSQSAWEGCVTVLVFLIRVILIERAVMLRGLVRMNRVVTQTNCPKSVMRI